MAYANTDEYIVDFPKDVQVILQKIRNLVKQEVPEAKEAMIYGVPGFKYNGKNLIIYAAFKKHIGIYPEPETIEHFKKDLQDYETSKGAIKFPYEKTLPIELLRKIIRYKKKS